MTRAEAKKHLLATIGKEGAARTLLYASTLSDQPREVVKADYENLKTKTIDTDAAVEAYGNACVEEVSLTSSTKTEAMQAVNDALDKEGIAREAYGASVRMVFPEGAIERDRARLVITRRNTQAAIEAYGKACAEEAIRLKGEKIT